MAEIKLQKRYKYAGDIMPKLLDIGFDLETANDFLNSIPDADVVPRALAEEQSVLWRDHFNSIYETAKVTLAAEVAREIFEEIEKTLNRKIRRIEPEYERLDECFEKLSECGHSQHGYCKGVISTCEDLLDLLYDLKKKYTEDKPNDNK